MQNGLHRQLVAIGLRVLSDDEPVGFPPIRVVGVAGTTPDAARVLQESRPDRAHSTRLTVYRLSEPPRLSFERVGAEGIDPDPTRVCPTRES